jgi:hypothetical protein
LWQNWTDPLMLIVNFNNGVYSGQENCGLGSIYFIARLRATNASLPTVFTCDQFVPLHQLSYAFKFLFYDRNSTPVLENVAFDNNVILFNDTANCDMSTTVQGDTTSVCWGGVLTVDGNVEMNGVRFSNNTISRRIVPHSPNVNSPTKDRREVLFGAASLIVVDCYTCKTLGTFVNVTITNLEASGNVFEVTSLASYNQTANVQLAPAWTPLVSGALYVSYARLSVAHSVFVNNTTNELPPLTMESGDTRRAVVGPCVTSSNVVSFANDTFLFGSAIFSLLRDSYFAANPKVTPLDKQLAVTTIEIRGSVFDGNTATSTLTVLSSYCIGTADRQRVHESVRREQ